MQCVYYRNKNIHIDQYYRYTTSFKIILLLGSNSFINFTTVIGHSIGNIKKIKKFYKELKDNFIVTEMECLMSESQENANDHQE